MAEQSEYKKQTEAWLSEEGATEGAATEEIKADELNDAVNENVNEDEEAGEEKPCDLEPAEQARIKKELLALFRKLECRVKNMTHFRMEIKRLCLKSCRTRADVDRIRVLHEYMEEENLKMQCLVSKATALQQKLSACVPQELSIGPLLSEENLSSYANAIPPFDWEKAGNF